jgi:hypothetical protein
MTDISGDTSWSDGNTLTAAALNGNFTNHRTAFNTYAVQTNKAVTVSVTHTYSAAQTFTGGWTAAAACTISAGGLVVSAGGAAITGNSTVTGTLNVTSTLSQGGVAVPGGTGTNGKVTRWTAASTLADAAVSDDGTYTTNATQPRARITGAGETITVTLTGVTFNAAALNVGSLWAGGSPKRVTIPASAGGSYAFSFVGALTIPSGQESVDCRLRKNGTTTIGTTFSNTAQTTQPLAFSFQWDDDPSAGDYYEIEMASGGGTAVLSDPQLNVRKVW